MTKYKLIAPQHAEHVEEKDKDGKVTSTKTVEYKVGDVVESDQDLVKLFPGKFELATPPKSDKKSD